MRSTGVSSAFWNCALTTSPTKKRVPAAVDLLAHGALDERNRLIEHRHACRRAVVEREVVQRPRLDVDLHRLRELADDGAVFAVDRADRECAATGRRARGSPRTSRPRCRATWDRSSPGCTSSRSSGSGGRRSEPTTYRPEGNVHNSRLRSLSYSSRCSSLSTPSGNGPVGPVPPGAATERTLRALLRLRWLRLLSASMACAHSSGRARPVATVAVSARWLGEEVDAHLRAAP